VASERGKRGERRRAESGAELGFGEEKGTGKKVGEKGSRPNRFTPKSYICVAHPTEVRYGYAMRGAPYRGAPRMFLYS
jgi:hypothetical protein